MYEVGNSAAGFANNDSQDWTYEKLHLGNFLVNLFHELDNKVHQLVLQHGFCVEVCDQEGDIISLSTVSNRRYISGDSLSVPSPASVSR